MPSAPRLSCTRCAGALAIMTGVWIVALSQGVAAVPESTGGAASAPAQNPLPQVTVQARREAIAPRVHAFVGEALYLENDEGPARWNTPVCPSVGGLPRDEGEFVVTRLSQIARTAGVPLAGEKCSPVNLLVVVTADPAAFLTKWLHRYHKRIFGDGNAPNEINAFVDATVPVRVWYNSSLGPAGGATETNQATLSVLLGSGTADFTTSVPNFVSPQNDSRITRPAAWGLASTFIVVDSTQLQGVKIGQLADYVGMYAFARLKTAAYHGDAPTILQLFQGTRTQSPPGLTTWDEAFLEALYHTDAKLVLQRGMMVTRMVSHIVPAASP